MALACHHGDYHGHIPPAAPTFTYHDPFTDYGRKLNARYLAIEAHAGSEYAYRRDETTPHMFKVGFTASVVVDGDELTFTVERRWCAIGRLRCELSFSDGLLVRITQAQLKALLTKCAPKPKVQMIAFCYRDFRIEQNVLRNLQKVTQTAAVIYGEPPSAETLTQLAHERFVAFMARLDRELPLTDFDRAVKMELKAVENRPQSKIKSTPRGLAPNKIVQRPKVIDYPTLRVRKYA